MRQKNLRQVVCAEEGNAIGKALKESENGMLAHKASGALAKKLKDARSLCVLCEYHKKTPSILRAQKIAEYEIPEIELVSAEIRRAGAVALALNVDPISGGCDENDVIKAVNEQNKAQTDFPGPVPIIWSDFIVDQVQLAQAYVTGAKVVTLHSEATTHLSDLIDAAVSSFGLEPIVVIPGTSDDYLQRAKDAETAGTNILLITGLTQADMSRAEALRKECPSLALVAKIDANADQGLEEAETAWLFRDVGFDAVYISDVLYKFGVFSGKLFAAAPDSITSVIKAMRSKASSSFARASGHFSGKGEGAKEYLGDLLM
mmetsp:Transcript_17167/g.22300  ORF Transcript_17167/g.22300 Transcript_17167/m.22300 type:complete len:317 (-) Transcript_17167:2613-3563(-)